jgi:protein SCO1/2
VTAAALPIITLALSLAAGAPSLPPAAAAADLDEALGARAAVEVPLLDENSRPRTLASLLAPGRPLVLVLGYYRCPALCDLVLRGLTEAMKSSALRLGRDYTVAMVSIDPTETPAQARTKQQHVLGAAGHRDDPAARAAFPFLVGRDQAAVAALADSVGFRYARDARTGEYGHPAALVVLTPDGRISRYLYGITYRERDFRLALVEASAGAIGGIANRILLTCYRWDPAQRRYGLVFAGALRGGALLILAGVIATVALGFRAERRRHRRDSRSEARGLGGEAPASKEMPPP